VENKNPSASFPRVSLCWFMLYSSIRFFSFFFFSLFSLKIELSLIHWIVAMFSILILINILFWNRLLKRMKNRKSSLLCWVHCSISSTRRNLGSSKFRNLSVICSCLYDFPWEKKSSEVTNGFILAVIIISEHLVYLYCFMLTNLSW
jgi:hypothetical protein